MSAIFNFQSLLSIALLLICTCAYLRALFPNLMDRNKTGFKGTLWKCARIGERKSPYVAIEEILKEGNGSSQKNERVCMRNLMTVNEAKEVCQKGDAWKSIVAAYPALVGDGVKIPNKFFPYLLYKILKAPDLSEILEFLGTEINSCG